MKKLFSLCLILILAVVIAVSSSACKFTELNLKLSGSNKANVSDEVDKNDNSESDDDKKDGDDEKGEGDKDENKETPPADETEEPEEETPSIFPNNVNFYKYLTAFDNAQSTLKLSVDSLEMLTAYIEYVNFYGIKKQVEITLTYKIESRTPDFKTEFDKADASYKASARLVMECTAGILHVGNKGKYYLTSCGWDNLATKTLDPEKTQVSSQVDYAFKMIAPSVRAEDFDDFKINSVTKELNNIENSEQLRWAIQNGYKPNCKVGSSAESVLNQAKSVLREIVTDEMDDVTKLRAMYEWLALNVSYDNYAASEEVAILIDSNEIKSSEYDSWYADGVFNNRKAVCEGYAKALIIMAGIEGIPAIMVTGNGHAWNRVQVNGNWFVLDATHGDVHVNDSEVFSYNQFMITDAEKTRRGYPSTDFSDCPATTDFNVYEKVKIENLLTEFDLVVDSKAELLELLNTAKTRKGVLEDSTVSFLVKAENLTDFDTWRSDPDILTLSNSSLPPIVDLNGNVHYVLFLN